MVTALSPIRRRVYNCNDITARWHLTIIKCFHIHELVWQGEAGNIPILHTRKLRTLSLSLTYWIGRHWGIVWSRSKNLVGNVTVLCSWETESLRRVLGLGWRSKHKLTIILLHTDTSAKMGFLPYQFYPLFRAKSKAYRSIKPFLDYSAKRNHNHSTLRLSEALVHSS